MTTHFKIQFVIERILKIVMYKIFNIIIKKIKIQIILIHKEIKNQIQKYSVNFYQIYNLIELILNLKMEIKITNNKLSKLEELNQIKLTSHHMHKIKP